MVMLISHPVAAKAKDSERDAQLTSIGLHVLRFDDLQVLQETGAVLGVIFEWVEKQHRNSPNPNPP